MSSGDGARPRDEVVQLTAFKVGDEEYVIDILRVREIIHPQSITPIRRGPRYVEGVINLRGTVIPVIDLRRRFELPEEKLPRRKIMIVNVEGRTVGLIVDSVTEVVRVPRETIRPAPGLLGNGRAPFFLGVCRVRDRTLILLNVKPVVASEETIEPPSARTIMGDAP